MEDMEQKLESQENTDEVLETGVEETTEETVVVDEVETEAVLEPTLKKKGIKNFWKGVLCGALFSIVICGVVLVATGVFKKEEPQGNFIEEFLNSEGLVTTETQAKLKNIRSIIDEIYLYSDEIDEKLLQENIVRGYVAGLKEPYTVYYNEEETTALFESTSGTFGGIGVVIMQDRTTGLATFTTIYDDCPGKKAGFKSGDIVYKVNGEDVSGMDLDSIVTRIRGEVGTEVEITVLRGETGEEYTGVATRALIENDTVEYEMKDGKLGYIQLTAFESVTYEQFKEALEDLTKQGMKGLIVDLRNNTGGNLDTVCEILDLILPKGTIVSIKDKNGNGQAFSSDDEHKLNVPLVVLTNGYSASASEIFAGAVQDYEIGKLVGTKTYGKGIVQNIYNLGDGTSLKITSSEYFTPNGRNIHEKGIEPDVEIEYQYDEANPDKDNQLDKAIEVLKGM
jgi:carboxyl-terminal processing protease